MSKAPQRGGAVLRAWVVSDISLLNRLPCDLVLSLRHAIKDLELNCPPFNLRANPWNVSSGRISARFSCALAFLFIRVSRVRFTVAAMELAAPVRSRSKVRSRNRRRPSDGAFASRRIMPRRSFDWLANAKFSVTSRSPNMKVSLVSTWNSPTGRIEGDPTQEDPISWTRGRQGARPRDG